MATDSQETGPAGQLGVGSTDWIAAAVRFHEAEAATYRKREKQAEDDWKFAREKAAYHFEIVNEIKKLRREAAISVICESDTKPK